MSSVNTILGFAPAYYQTANRAMLDAAAADEADESEPVILESHSNVDLEIDDADEDDDDLDDLDPDFMLGSHIDARA